ncbi:L-alanine exporter AlaE [Vibrio sp. SCSIO 43136]|uniref:L-alanine exporter AlaE n=1 Tax=Vibrio sp. SCSIO 43136 TaxID=2819101 RepID=UPI0020763500|nr:L-alanine exporter AlaE [Vibrio sp. SCSIO 43136]USD64311.1 L-alanine exporter AlaE [Vibrio sp. SCSIO 43136]
MKLKGVFCVRNFAADTFAMVVFSFIAGMIIEVMISGMSFEQSLASRMLSIPVNIAIAMPYGVFRDWALRTGRRVHRSELAQKVSDIIAYVAFQSPVYALILISIGATSEQILTAVSGNLVGYCILGVLYGYFVDACRKWFRVPGYIQSA